MGTHITKHADDVAFRSEGSMWAKEESSWRWQSNRENYVLWSKENYWKVRDINEYCPSDRTLDYMLHARNFFMILKIGSFCNRDHGYCRTKRELLRLIENMQEIWGPSSLAGASWGYVGERILKNISSLWIVATICW